LVAFGPVRVANELRKRGLTVSAAGVRRLSPARTRKTVICAGRALADCTEDEIGGHHASSGTGSIIENTWLSSPHAEPWRFSIMATEFYSTPELQIKDGRPLARLGRSLSRQRKRVGPPDGRPHEAPGFSLRGGPNFPVLVVHRVVPAKLATGKSDSFVLSGKRSHGLAARAHDAPCSRH
jgi:hypothetical protein